MTGVQEVLRTGTEKQTCDDKLSPFWGAGRLFYIRALSDKMKQMKRVSVDHRWALLPSCLPEFSLRAIFTTLEE